MQNTVTMPSGDVAMVATLKSEILPLTFFRFVAAFMIFLFHMRIHFAFDTHFVLLNKATSQGAIFMSAFFILSGFVLRYAYYDSDLLDKTKLKKYYLRRFAKIYPAYFVVVFLSYLLFFDGKSCEGLAAIPMQLFGMQSLFYKTFDFYINGLLWSLSVEFFFYTLFPFFNYLFSFVKRTHVVFVFVYLFSIYPSVVHAVWGPTQDLYVSPVFRLPDFFAGMCIANIYQLKMKDKFEARFAGYFLIAAFVALLVSVGVLSDLQFMNGKIFNGNFCYFNIVTIPLFSYIIYALSVMSSPTLLFLLSNRFCNYLGKISYAFYLTQFIAIGYIGLGRRWFFTDQMPQYTKFLTLFTVNFVCAVLLYEIVEKRVRRFILKHY